MKWITPLLPFVFILPLAAQDRSPVWRNGADALHSTTSSRGLTTAEPTWFMPGRPAGPAMPVSLASDKSRISFNAGIVRFTPQSAYYLNAPDERPWFRAGVGILIPSVALKPFIGLGATFPLTSGASDPAPQDSVIKLLTPKGEVGIYGGIRF